MVFFVYRMFTSSINTLQLFLLCSPISSTQLLASESPSSTTSNPSREIVNSLASMKTNGSALAWLLLPNWGWPPSSKTLARPTQQFCLDYYHCHSFLQATCSLPDPGCMCNLASGHKNFRPGAISITGQLNCVICVAVIQMKTTSHLIDSTYIWLLLMEYRTNSSSSSSENCIGLG